MKNATLCAALFAALFVLASALVAVVPFGVIWMFNTLFQLHTPYSFESWCAVVGLSAVLKLVVHTYK
jgi:uncharacterized membrane protein